MTNTGDALSALEWLPKHEARLVAEEARDDIAVPKKHCEIWASTPTYAHIAGGAHTLLGALTLYVRTRSAERDRTIALLVDVLPPDRSA